MTQPAPNGEDHNLEKVITEYLPALYSAALALSGNRVIAEDLVHDCCVKALTASKREHNQDLENSVAWLYKILMNTFRDHYRRETNSPFANANDEYQNVIRFVPGSGHSPENDLANRDFEQALQFAISALPFDIRTVVVLNLVHGSSYKDISKIVECPIGTVMSRLSRGKALLRDSLQHHCTGSQQSLVQTKSNKL